MGAHTKYNKIIENQYQCKKIGDWSVSAFCFWNEIRVRVPTIVQAFHIHFHF